MLLGISGFMGSGKDTMGDYLVERYGYQKTAFAWPLKETIKTLFDMTDEQVYGKLKEIPDERYRFTGICMQCGRSCTDYRGDHSQNDCREGHVFWCHECNLQYPEFVTPRLAMQTLGTEWGRRLHDNIWVNACITRIRNSDHTRWAVTDVRFRNEVQAVQDAGGLVIRLRRGELVTKHPSEAELAGMEDSEFDYTIDNQGTLKELYAHVDHIMPGLLRDR